MKLEENVLSSFAVSDIYSAAVNLFLLNVILCPQRHSKAFERLSEHKSTGKVHLFLPTVLWVQYELDLKRLDLAHHIPSWADMTSNARNRRTLATWDPHFWMIILTSYSTDNLWYSVWFRDSLAHVVTRLIVWPWPLVRWTWTRIPTRNISTPLTTCGLIVVQRGLKSQYSHQHENILSQWHSPLNADRVKSILRRGKIGSSRIHSRPRPQEMGG